MAAALFDTLIFSHKLMNAGMKIDLVIKEFDGKFNLLYWMMGFALAFFVAIVFKLYF